MRVLFIAYYYPPAGGGGVQRSAKFVKYLRRLGIEVTVLTAERREESALGPVPLDRSLLGDVAGAAAEIVRLPDPEPVRVRRWLERRRIFRLAWTFGFRWFAEAGAAWCRTAARAAPRIAREQNADLVYTSSGPYRATIAGRRVQRRAGIPWVADFRDPWTDDFIGVWPTPLHYLLERRFQRRMLRAADLVIANTPTLRDLFLGIVGNRHRDRIEVLPNGFDAEDFDGDAPKPGGPFTIVYAGTLEVTPDKYDGRSWTRRVQRWLTYSPHRYRLDAYGLRYVAAAIALLRRERPEVASEIRVEVFGYATPYHRDAVERAGVADAVRFHGQVDHPVSVAAIRRADALLLLSPSSADPIRRFPRVLGKTYEYMATNNPILALVPEGDMKDFLRAAGTAVFARPDDPADIARAIADLVGARRDGRSLVSANPAAIREFDRRRQAIRLANLFARVAPRSTPPDLAARAAELLGETRP
jgi:glycosyltransferase involved in cell wall biosynthesis